MELFPAIDLIGGCAVRLVKGDYAQKTVYSDNPAEYVANALSPAEVLSIDVDDDKKMCSVVVPEDLRSKLGQRMIGCDICQLVCPMQTIPPQKNTNAYTLDEFVTDDPGAFSQAAAKLAQEIGRNAARPQRIRAQAALLAGNSRNKQYLPVLRSWAQLPFEAVRAHALWAIRRIEKQEHLTRSYKQSKINRLLNTREEPFC